MQLPLVPSHSEITIIVFILSSIQTLYICVFGTKNRLGLRTKNGKTASRKKISVSSFFLHPSAKVQRREVSFCLRLYFCWCFGLTGLHRKQTKSDFHELLLRGNIKMKGGERRGKSAEDCLISIWVLRTTFPVKIRVATSVEILQSLGPYFGSQEPVPLA